MELSLEDIIECLRQVSQELKRSGNVKRLGEIMALAKALERADESLKPHADRIEHLCQEGLREGGNKWSDAKSTKGVLNKGGMEEIQSAVASIPPPRRNNRHVTPERAFARSPDGSNLNSGGRSAGSPSGYAYVPAMVDETEEQPMPPRRALFPDPSDEGRNKHVDASHDLMQVVSEEVFAHHISVKLDLRFGDVKADTTPAKEVRSKLGSRINKAMTQLGYRDPRAISGGKGYEFWMRRDNGATFMEIRNDIIRRLNELSKEMFIDEFRDNRASYGPFSSLRPYTLSFVISARGETYTSTVEVHWKWLLPTSLQK